MPTDYRIGRLTCNLDLEQDPAIWTCNIIGQELPSGEVVGGNINFEAGDTLDGPMDSWAEDNDYTLV